MNILVILYYIGGLNYTTKSHKTRVCLICLGDRTTQLDVLRGQNYTTKRQLGDRTAQLNRNLGDRTTQLTRWKGLKTGFKDKTKYGKGIELHN